MPGGPNPLRPGAFLIRVIICQGGSVSRDKSNYRAPKKNGPDRQRELERDWLEISVTTCRSSSLGSGSSLIRVAIYQVGSVSLGTSDYSAPKAKRDRPKAVTGTRLSGDISYVLSPHACTFRDFPDHRKHLPGRFGFA